jgi:hypothetical protein
MDSSGVASIKAPPVQQVTTKNTSHLFSKQCLHLNPNFPHLLSLNDDDRSCSTDEESIGSMNDDESMLMYDDNSAVTEGSPVPGDNFDVTRFIATNLNKSKGISKYPSFTSSQKYITSLIHILDEMECPDYAFQHVMDWAHTSYQAGFDFSPKCKTQLGNLRWMYDIIYNCEQMLPDLERIDLPDSMPTMKTMDVICYGFVPQLLSILQDEKMSGSNLVLDPNTPLAMYNHQMAG